MTTQTETPTAEYHYVTTIQMPGAVINTRDGILTVPVEFTRAAAFNYLMGQLKDEYQTQISVLFFSSEPNRLA
ncbi:hypothetical protein OG384_04445 [Streptomyces sp. NBC_01324]|uniref:hypothetical protein n=1 Tax=Streptomyces sp. NBC_01324 TaxID=2903826 RepID=UPI002E0D306C|nr:hypothetical protein OG384_04445 [Streptomyces sp. NBC_01324]